MDKSRGSLAKINAASLYIALGSILVAVITAILLVVWPGPGSWRIKVLIICAVLFVGAASTLCTIKYFYANQDGSENS